jgi:putative methionine-R-sulfoxide reductase with GAF domain
MAEPVTAQARLDRIVVLIASNMVAEVCSLYVARADGLLELFATEGLNREAVHLTTIRAGEGLIGLIADTADPLSLSDAQMHPAYSHEPEIGEESYQSFLGVPVLRGGATLGVLVIQNRARRIYSDEEIEALQTTAMLLAEMIASGELEGLAGKLPSAKALRKAVAQIEQLVAEKLGLSKSALHKSRIVVSKIVADDVNADLARLETAIEAMHASIDELVDRSDNGAKGELRDALDAFRTIAHDRDWLQRLREVVTGGLTAEAAVERVQNARAKLQRQTGPNRRDQRFDLNKVASRLLLYQLTEQSHLLEPVEGVVEGINFQWLPGHPITISPDSPFPPKFPTPPSQNDYYSRLAEAKRLGESLIDILSRRQFADFCDFRDCVDSYLRVLPVGHGLGEHNIVPADNQARILRAMFAAQVNLLPIGISAQLQVFLENHQSLRPFSDGIERFYEAVRKGKIARPLSLDAMQGFARGVAANSPMVFAPSVRDVFRESAMPVPSAAEQPAVALSPASSIPKPPSDPLESVSARAQHDYFGASLVNSLVRLAGKGKTLSENLKGWKEAWDQLNPYAAQIIDWLRLYHGSSESGPPPTIGA